MLFSSNSRIGSTRTEKNRRMQKGDDSLRSKKEKVQGFDGKQSWQFRNFPEKKTRGNICSIWWRKKKGTLQREEKKKLLLLIIGRKRRKEKETGLHSKKGGRGKSTSNAER